MAHESPVKPFERVLHEDETPAILKRRALIDQLLANKDESPMAGVPYKRNLPEAGGEECGDPAVIRPFGVCFSGGGIRSATFNLGVLQGLARQGLLPYIDYLSTVSGGGYIGSWLHGIIRAHGGDPAAAQDVLARVGKPGKPEDDPITFLRKYSNYLSPHLGLFSADCWVIAGVWIRNMGLNLLIMLPFLISVVLLARAFGMAQASFGADGSRLWWLWAVAVAISASIIAYRLRTIIKREMENLPQPHANEPAKLRRLSHHPNLMSWIGVFAAMTSAYLVGAAPVSSAVNMTPRAIFLVTGALFLCHQLLGGFLVCYHKRHDPSPHVKISFWEQAGRALWPYLLMLLISATCAAVMALGMSWIVSWLVSASLDNQWIPVTLGPGLIVLLWMVAVSLEVGLMGADFPDTAREWMTSFGAQLGIVAASWTAILTLSIFGPLWLAQVAAAKGPWAATAFWSGVGGWVSSGLGTVAAGASSRTKGKSADDAKNDTKDSGDPEGGTRLPGMEAIAAVAPTVFMILSFFLVAFGAHMLMRRMLMDDLHRASLAVVGWQNWLTDIRDNYWAVLEQFGNPPHTREANWSYVCEALVPSAVGFLIAFVLSLRALQQYRNEFSMHHFYKNRLVRCYLGAGNAPKRDPDSLTGCRFHRRLQDSPLSCPKMPKRPYAGPYAIVNCALNLNTGSELSTAERKAASFVFTPRVCGFEPQLSSADAAPHQTLSNDGYRATAAFMMKNGPDLGTAMAISGAAASPNWGYHTSTPMAFLLTVFNVRLGWWVGQPPPRQTERSFRTARRLAQLVGRTFCANRQPQPLCQPLGRRPFREPWTVRTCAPPLPLHYRGRRRRRPQLLIRSAGRRDSQMPRGFWRRNRYRRRFTAPRRGEARERGTLRGGVDLITAAPTPKARAYPMCDEAEPADADDMTGWLVYFKSSLTGDEAEDVQQYKVDHPVFPHESTADQFFSESQFESYRKLGQHVVESTFERTSAISPPVTPASGCSNSSRTSIASGTPPPVNRRRAIIPNVTTA